MASDITKDALYFRRRLKILTREILTRGPELSTCLAQIKSLGIAYDGTVPAIPADAEADAGYAALAAVAQVTRDQNEVLNKLADWGDNTN
jgi:coenzyme F420-reducing hydrogenase gamma subunit